MHSFLPPPPPPPPNIKGGEVSRFWKLDKEGRHEKIAQK